MIHNLVFDTLKKFKQRPDEDLYYDQMKEETEEFFKAETKEERIKEAVDILWVTVGYLWSVFRGNENKVLKAYKSVYQSNISKVCYTEEEADQTMEKYKEKGINTVAVRYDDDDGEYWIVYDKKNKYKKGINYKEADLSWINN